MKAIMLAAGKGTRCYPFTHIYPKLFQQVCGIPVIEYMLSWFHGLAGLEQLYLVVNHETPMEKIHQYLNSRKSRLRNIMSLFERLGYKVDYVNPDFVIEPVEAHGRGTGGDLRTAIETIKLRGRLDGDVIVCNSDYATISQQADGSLSPQINIGDIMRYHRACNRELGTVMTVALTAVAAKDGQNYGIAQTRQMQDSLIIKGFNEKPAGHIAADTLLINAGLYVIDWGFILGGLDTYLPDGPHVDLEKTLIERLTTEEAAKLAAYVLHFYRWFDIGTPEKLVDASICIASEGQSHRVA